MQDNDQRIANKRQKLIVIELSFEKISKTAKPRNFRHFYQTRLEILLKSD